MNSGCIQIKRVIFKGNNYKKSYGGTIMKKWIAVICAVTLGFSATGCGQTKEVSVKRVLSEKPAGEITVSCYDTMVYKDFLKKAAKSFEKSNPDTKIKVEAIGVMPEVKESESDGVSVSVVTTGDDEQERLDYISKINTELMSGKGADVLAMDILPYYKYADSGQLEDLQTYMKEDSSFDISDYRKTVLDAMKYHGGLYVMPLDYMFDYIAYDTTFFTGKEKQRLQGSSKFTYKQLIQSGKIPFQRANISTAGQIRMFRLTEPQMFRKLLRLDYGNYIDIENRKVNFTDGSFVKLLESVREYGEKGYLEADSESGQLTIEDFEKIKQEKLLFKIKGSYSLLSDVLRSTGKKDFSSFDTSGGDENNDKILGVLANENGDINLDYMQAYGINSNSKNKTLAWAFIKFLMSEKMQSSTEFSGLPINNKALKEKVKMDISDILGISSDKGSENQNKELTETQRKVYDYYLKSVNDFSDELNHYTIQDDTVKEMINTEVTYYFDGSKKATEVASTLQEKIQLYLNE